MVRVATLKKFWEVVQLTERSDEKERMIRIEMETEPV